MWQDIFRKIHIFFFWAKAWCLGNRPIAIAGGLSLLLVFVGLTLFNTTADSSSVDRKIATLSDMDTKDVLELIDQVDSSINQLQADSGETTDGLHEDAEKYLLLGVGETAAELVEPESTDFSTNDMNVDYAMGRGNPFDPLVRATANGTSEVISPLAADMEQALFFTGLVGDPANPKKTVAILKTAGVDGNGSTLVKRVGEPFMMEGKEIVIDKIDHHSIQVRVSGMKRTLELTPYSDVLLAPPVNNATATGSESPVNLDGLTEL